MRRRIHPWRTRLAVELALERGQQLRHGTLDFIVVHDVVEAQLVLALLLRDLEAAIDLVQAFRLAADQAADQLGEVGVDKDRIRRGERLLAVQGGIPRHPPRTRSNPGQGQPGCRPYRAAA